MRPGLDKAAVRFQVVSEGERGLLGVGYAPARVVARRCDDAPVRRRPRTRAPRRPASRELIERIAAALELHCRIEVHEDEETIVATCTGRDLGLLIGKHGQTIDALQYLANAIVAPRPVRAAEVDRRRRGRLPRPPPGGARRARRARGRAGAPVRARAVELDPMTAVERKVVHLRLKDFDGVETTSEGTEPNRFVVVHPAGGERRCCSSAGSRRSSTTPGLTALALPERAARCCSRTRCAPCRSCARLEGPLVDVGSGGGAPGIPLAASLPEREVTLLEAERRKCEFLERCAGELAEPARRLGPRRGAADRRVRRRGREGARAAAGRGRVVPAARAPGRLRRALRRAERPSLERGRGASRSRSAAASRSSRDGLLVDPRRSRRRRPGFPRRPGVAQQASARVSVAAVRLREQNGGVRAHVYAIANQKGGVGKTTTAINLAACLAEAGERSLVVDLDPQANATSGPRRARERRLVELRPARRRAARASSRSRRGSRTSTSSRRSPSSPAPRSSSRGATTASATSRRRSRAARDDYAFVFVDCPPSLGPLTVNALAAADRVIVPVQAEYYALEGLVAARAARSSCPGAAQPAPRARRRAADDGGRPHAARGRGRERGAAALRQARLRPRPCRARCASPRRRATGCP